MDEALETTVGKFTFKVVVDRLYTAEGVWAQANGSVLRIGLSDYLQQHSGDIAFVEVKPAGTRLAFGQEAASIETIKVNIDLKSPLAGAILRVNPLMETAPETINLDPYGEGWLCEIEPSDWAADQKNLLQPAAYFAIMKQAAEDEVKN